jgi:MFS family permease
VNEPLPNSTFELRPIGSRRVDKAMVRSPSQIGLPEQRGSTRLPLSQGIPPELRSFLAEIVFVLACSAGQLICYLILGPVAVTQSEFRDALGITPTQTPWLVGSFLLANGLSVIIFGSLADLVPPKPLMVGAFVWEAIWNIVAAVTIRPNLKILFFVSRAMQGLAIGVLVSASMSVLGRVYNPGLRKTRVFSLMAAGAPLGYWIGCLQGGALKAHLPWIFGSTAIFVSICAVAAQFAIPHLRPASDGLNTAAPSLRQFDFTGAFLASVGCALILFGLTQGAVAHWNPYTYSAIILGFLMLAGFYFVERIVSRPLIPNGLWRTPGFAALLVAYFLGMGAYGKILFPCFGFVWSTY